MKKNKKRSIKLFSSICFVFVLIGVSFVSAFSSVTATTTETQLSSSPSFSLYCVCTSKSQVESESTTIGKDVMKNGGAGYVWKKDNYYYVISSAYENKNDADLVSAQFEIEDIDSEIIEIKFNSINLSNPLTTAESKSTFNAGINLFHTLYKNLFDLSVSLDTNIIDETQSLLEINRNQAMADEVMKNFHIVFGDVESDLIEELDEAIIDANESLGLLSENEKICEQQTLVSQIRYCYCEICEIFFSFLTEIA